MPIFVAVLNRHSDKVAERMGALSVGSKLQLKPDTWLIDYDGSARSLAEELGMRGSDPDDATGIVFPITNYSGRAAPEVWDWLQSHMSVDFV